MSVIQSTKTTVRCKACNSRRQIVTDTEWTPLCQPCVNRIGLTIRPGSRVVCQVTDDCSGVVQKIHDGSVAQIETNDGGEAWIPLASLVVVKAVSK